MMKTNYQKILLKHSTNLVSYLLEQQETTKNYKNCLRYTQMTQNTYKMSLNFSWNKKNNSYDVSDTETPDTIKSKH